jgi:hypothetical protein
MATVNSHAAPTPTASTPRNHDCGVGASTSGFHCKNAYAAATDTASWMNRMPNYSEAP